MNVRRFSARSAREALGLVRQAFGDDAVVLSTRPAADGVEVLAMAGEGVPAFDAAPPAPGAAAPAAAAVPAAAAAESAAGVEQDVAKLSMSTLSFQDYVRERMLRRRRAEQQAQQRSQADAQAAQARAEALAAAPQPPAAALRTRAAVQAPEPPSAPPPQPPLHPSAALPPQPPVADELPWLHEAAAGAAEAEASRARTLPPAAAAAAMAVPIGAGRAPAACESAATLTVLDELRAMRGLIEDRFGALAFMEKLRRQPRQAQLTQRLLDLGFSPALVRKLVDGLPGDCDEMTWAASVLERNLPCGEAETALEDAGGVYALVGATGVGKTTSTAKLAAAFATRHGAANLGLITLDAYRVAAHEQLRAYGRILGVPVHTAHDRASLEDLLDLLAGKKLVLIDTAGMAQRDARTRELLDMLSHRKLQRLLVLNAAAQGETIDDVLAAYRAGSCRGVILSKVDEAVKLAPALDAMIRHKLKVLAVANGQRVPEDWHRLSAAALVRQALRPAPSGAWRMDAYDVQLVFAGLRARPEAPAAAHA